ncbi:MAG: rhomboid family intramembrane serine protease [Bacteroidales bacterium]|nr:rhomboid family intramembrane serine protease [Bacteroidales bacterium]
MFRNLTPVVKNLLIVNAGLLVLTYLLSYAGIDLVKILGLFYFKSEYFMPYQFVSHMFMHGGLVHLLFNMYALLLFGSILERIWGPKRFLFYYLFTGLGAAALHTAVNWYLIHDFYSSVQDFLVHPYLENFQALTQGYSRYFNQDAVSQIINNWQSYDKTALRESVDNALQAQMNIPTVGASGAVFGLLLAFGMMFPNAPLGIIFIPVRIKAKWFVIGYGALELISGIRNASGDNIAHFAHLGGMIFGFILLKIWYKGNLKQQ